MCLLFHVSRKDLGNSICSNVMCVYVVQVSDNTWTLNYKNVSVRMCTWHIWRITHRFYLRTDSCGSARNTRWKNQRTRCERLYRETLSTSPSVVNSIKNSAVIAFHFCFECIANSIFGQRNEQKNFTRSHELLFLIQENLYKLLFTASPPYIKLLGLHSFTSSISTGV